MADVMSHNTPGQYTFYLMVGEDVRLRRGNHCYLVLLLVSHPLACKSSTQVPTRDSLSPAHISTGHGSIHRANTFLTVAISCMGRRNPWVMYWYIRILAHIFTSA